MKHLIPVILLYTCTFNLHLLSAAVPLRWTVETSRAQPATFEAYQGETLELEAALQSYGKPLEAPSNYALYWQTNGMGSTYWSTNVSNVSNLSNPSNLLRATWRPEYDVGAKTYTCFIGQPGTIYHAAFQLRLRPSPGAVPNELPLPVKTIDFSQVTVLNPPWPDPSLVKDRRRIDDLAVYAQGFTRWCFDDLQPGYVEPADLYYDGYFWRATDNDYKSVGGESPEATDVELYCYADESFPYVCRARRERALVPTADRLATTGRVAAVEVRLDLSLPRAEFAAVTNAFRRGDLRDKADRTVYACVPGPWTVESREAHFGGWRPGFPGDDYTLVCENGRWVFSSLDASADLGPDSPPWLERLPADFEEGAYWAHDIYVRISRRVGARPTDDRLLCRADLDVAATFATPTGVVTVTTADYVSKHLGGGGFVFRAEPSNDYEDSITNVFLAPAVTKLGPNAFRRFTALRRVDFPFVTDVSLPKATVGGVDFGARQFQHCARLEEVRLPALRETSHALFDGCTSLVRVNLDGVTTVNPTSALFQSCPRLQEVSFRSMLSSQLMKTANFPWGAANEGMAFLCADSNLVYSTGVWRAVPR